MKSENKTCTISLFGKGVPLPKGVYSAFEHGKQDRLIGKPCCSSNGKYLDGWYSLPNTFKGGL